MNKARPFEISKHLVWRAYELVRKKKGAAGVDHQSIEKFEENLKDNLYKIWNRMSSGSYFPPPVKAVEIPKKDGKKRKLGIPTVTDRIAQMVVKLMLEPVIDPIFHENSFGYRPNKSAHQAIHLAKQRCWKYNWVIDLDIKGFFDQMNHDLVMKALKHHTKCKWILLYVERWLKCSMLDVDGEIKERKMGTPQGGVISPLLANLYLHYAFDEWMVRNYPDVKFERYADDAVIHCKKLKEANDLLYKVRARMNDCKLDLHKQKTKIVFCHDTKRDMKTNFPTEFDFLGMTFKRRTAMGRDGRPFDGFMPGISKSGLKSISDEIRSWNVGRASDLSLEQISKMYNPKLRGWVNYYAPFYPRALRPINRQWRAVLNKWARRKFKRFGGYKTNAGDWLLEVSRKETHLFAIWEVFGEV